MKTEEKLTKRLRQLRAQMDRMGKPRSYDEQMAYAELSHMAAFVEGQIAELRGAYPNEHPG